MLLVVVPVVVAFVVGGGGGVDWALLLEPTCTCSQPMEGHRSYHSEEDVLA